MDGSWQWGFAQGPPTRSSYWSPSQSSHSASQFSRSASQSAHDGYGSNTFSPPSIHDSFHAPRSRPDPALTPAVSEFHQVQHQYESEGYDLDDFDRQLLGMSELPASHPQSARRLTLPQAQPTARHAFQPASQLPHTYKPMFQPVAQAQVGGYSSRGYTPDYQQSVTGYLSHPRLTYHPEPVPAATAATIREPVHRHRDLQPRLQQDAPQSYPASHTYQQVRDPATPPVARRPSDVESLSPSEGVGLRRQSRPRQHSQRKGSSMLSSSSSSQQQRPSSPVSVGATGAPPVVHGIQLVSPRQALPGNMFYESIFPYPVFNAVQSKCFESVYGSSDNLVVSAPTGSGKTAIFELAICRLVADMGRENIKIVYQAPTKALCSERAKDWAKKFSALQLQCAELTGDTSQAEMRRVGSATIIVTTPEKWDSITRKWHDHQKLLKLVALFLIDEVHILKDPRGATLEAVVSRMKSIGTDVRFVALSATIPNSEDIATWLGQNVRNQNLPARLETFSDDFRPVKLVRHVFGFQKRQNDHAFDKLLDTKLPELLKEHTEGKPILVFCFTRKSCENTAKMLAGWCKSLPEDKMPWPKPSTPVRVVARELHDMVEVGVAFHHAGLVQEDRQAIEQAFIKGDLSVICCTSTLAVGVNLPCHTVVLKGTVTYQNDAIHELSDLEALQMLGRAGRPQFDDSANALILTSTNQKERYERMASGKEILESTLHLHLIEHLNSEIGLRTITDMTSAKKWLAGTFLSVRMRKNPSYYRLAEGTSTATDTDSMLEEICERDIKLLQDYKIITQDQTFKQTEYGAAMARYMVEFSTMKLLLDLPRALSMEQLLNGIAKANEFREFKFKPADGQIFRDVNKSPFILYRIEENVNKTWHKVSLVVQLQLGGDDYPDSSESQRQRQQLRAEKKGIFARLAPLVRCVAECKGYERDSISVKTALDLHRSLAADAWEGRPSELLQIPQIGPVYMRRLISQGVKTVKDLVHKDSGEIAALLGRNPPFGKTMSDTLKTFPLLGMDLAIPSRKYTFVNGGDSIAVPLVATLRYLNQSGLPKWNGKVPSVTFMAETTAGLLVYFWRGFLDKIPGGTGLELRFSAEIRAQEERVVCHFSCDDIVGTVVSKMLEHSVPASAFKKLKPRAQVLEATRRAKPIETGHGALAERTKLVQADVGSLAEGDLDDAEAIEAAAAFDGPADETRDDLQTGGKKTESQKTAESSYSDGDFPMDDILAAESAPKPVSHPPPAPSQAHQTSRVSAQSASAVDTPEKEPVRLPNGKWQCNHVCTGGAPTKAGKKCTHRCCIEGLDKPRRLKTKEQKEAESAKRKADESKKRKAEGPSDQGNLEKTTNADSAGSGIAATTAVKKPRLSEQSPPAEKSTQPVYKPVPELSSEIDVSQSQQDAPKHVATKFNHVASSDVDDGYESFPDVDELASRKFNDNKTSGLVTGALDADKSSASSLMDDYLPSAPPGTTTDYGSLEDDFDDDFDFELQSLPEEIFTEKSNTAPAVKKSVDTGSAFKSEGRDRMLPDTIARESLSAQSSKTTVDMSPDSYQAALEAAAKLCDVADEPDTSFQYNLYDPLPDNDDYDLDLFSEAMSMSDLMDTSDTTPAGESVEHAHPASPAAAFGAEDSGGGGDAGNSALSGPELAKKGGQQEGDPEWLAEFDPEFVNDFRGFVNFV